MAPPHHFHSLLPSPHFVTLLLLLLHTVSTTCSPASNTPSPQKGLTKRAPRIRGNFIVTPAPINTSGNTPSENRKMMFVIIGVIGGLIFLALCCYAVQCLFKAYQRRRVREASQSINTRRASTDSIWGIPQEPNSAYPREDRTYDMYPQPNPTSLGTATISRGQSGTMEKELGFPAWKTQPIESPGNWGRNQPSPAYHENGYTGIPPYDLEKGNQYSRESLPPMVPPKSNKITGPRDTTSAIIEDRFGPGVINRSETRSSYDSYRQTASAAPARPPTTPKPFPMPMI